MKVQVPFAFNTMVVGLVWFGLVWFGLVWFGLVWFGLVWFGLVWFGLVWFGVWFGLVWFGLVWFGLVWFGLVFGLVWFGLVFGLLCFAWLCFALLGLLWGGPPVVSRFFGAVSHSTRAGIGWLGRKSSFIQSPRNNHLAYSMVATVAKVPQQRPPFPPPPTHNPNRASFILCPIRPIGVQGDSTVGVP